MKCLTHSREILYFSSIFSNTCECLGGDRLDGALHAAEEAPDDLLIALDGLELPGDPLAELQGERPQDGHLDDHGPHGRVQALHDRHQALQV